MTGLGETTSKLTIFFFFFNKLRNNFARRWNSIIFPVAWRETSDLITFLIIDNKMIEALTACEPDILQVFSLSQALETDQRILGQLSDLYDRELVGVIGNFFFLILQIFRFSHFYTNFLFCNNRLGEASTRV